MFRRDLQVSNGKRYVVIECQFGHEWGMVRETRETVIFASRGELIFNNLTGVISERLLKQVLEMCVMLINCHALLRKLIM